MCRLVEEKELFDKFDDVSIESLLNIDSGSYFKLRAKDHIYPEVKLSIGGCSANKVKKIDEHHKRDVFSKIKPHKDWTWAFWNLKVSFQDKNRFEYIIRKYNPSYIMKEYNVITMEDEYVAYFGNILPLLKELNYKKPDIRYANEIARRQDNRFSAFQTRVFIEEARIAEMIKRAKEAA
jgi:hypothetical protein